MERPKIQDTPLTREVTGEIVYLDEMRRLKLFPTKYDDLSDMAIVMYEETADLFRSQNARPDIMDEYEANDCDVTETEYSCLAMADELLSLKDNDEFTFVDIIVDSPADEVLRKLESIRAGELLAGEDDQLAIESDGTRYPVLDIKKKDLKLDSVSVRVFGWDHDKYAHTNSQDEKYSAKEHRLVYPSSEKYRAREIELNFGYRNKNTYVTEAIYLYLVEGGEPKMSSKLIISDYAETGYEGHGRASLHECTDKDLADFGDLIAEIVGDNPETYKTRRQRSIDNQ